MCVCLVIVEKKCIQCGSEFPLRVFLVNFVDVASTSQDDTKSLLNTEHTLNEAANQLRKISTTTNDIEKKSNESETKQAFWVGND